MSLLIHNLKIAVRNLMKYKLQTVISVLSIAIGIVALAFVHGAVERVKLPSLYHQSYYDRSYQIWFDSLNRAPDADANWTRVNKEIVRALKRDSGLRFAEKLAVANHRISDLEDNNKWLWRTTFGAIITSAIAILFKFV